MKRHTPLRIAASLALAAACPLTMAQTDAPLRPTDLTCQFQASAGPAGQVTLQFTLRNAGSHDLQLLKWGSPFEGGWFGPFVKASTPQGELPFQGAMRKRGDPAAQDYLPLRAGQTLTATLNLGDAYALPAAGTAAASPLKLTAAWRWHDVVVGGTAAPPRPRAQHQGMDQACGAVTVAR